MLTPLRAYYSLNLYLHNYAFLFQSSHYGNRSSKDSPFVRQQHAGYKPYSINYSSLKASSNILPFFEKNITPYIV